MTQDTEDVVARLAAWSNDPDDEPPIVLMMAAKSELQSLSDRIDVLEGAGNALIADVRARYPGEELRCPHMIALDAALHQEGING